MNVLAGCHARIRPWTREPLLHFAAIGLALFAISRASASSASSTERRARIEVTEDDLHQLTVAWRAQWHRDPTPSGAMRSTVTIPYPIRMRLLILGAMLVLPALPFGGLVYSIGAVVACAGASFLWHAIVGGTS